MYIGAVQLLRNARGGRPSVTLCDGGSAERYVSNVTPLKYICIIYIIIFIIVYVYLYVIYTCIIINMLGAVQLLRSGGSAECDTL